MRAVQLKGFHGVDDLALVDIAKPQPAANELLIQVKAAGINFAELELIRGKYPASKPLPYVPGFEVAGVVAETGPEVRNFAPGDRVAAVMPAGGYAEYAVADAGAAFPIPSNISFAEATSIVVQGLTAYIMLETVARPRSSESILIQSAAGGVGLFLVQLARLHGVGKIIALAGSREKLELVRRLGADVAIDYTEEGWESRVLECTEGRGVDIVLEAASGEVRAKCFGLLAPFGRTIVFGARNIHDSTTSEQMTQLIRKNQIMAGFNLPSIPPEQIGRHLPKLLELIVSGQVKLFARHAFPLLEFESAFQALSSRQTVGKVVLEP